MSTFINSPKVNTMSFFNNYDEFIDLHIISVYINSRSTSLSLSLKNVKINNIFPMYNVSHDDNNTSLIFNKEINSNLSYDMRLTLVKEELFNILNTIKQYNPNVNNFGIVYTHDGDVCCYKDTIDNIINFL